MSSRTRIRRAEDPGHGLLDNPVVRAAIGSMSVRAASATGEESALSGERSTATYVDPKLLDQLATPDYQIIYGRRGTGKTHALQVLEKRLRPRSSEIVIFTDLRNLGDASEPSDTERA